MDLDEALAVIREQHRAVLTTLRADGTPQMSPVLVAVDDDGYPLVSTRETAIKVRNLRRDRRLWLCVLPDRFGSRTARGRSSSVAAGPAVGRTLATGGIAVTARLAPRYRPGGVSSWSPWWAVR